MIRHQLVAPFLTVFCFIPVSFMQTFEGYFGNNRKQTYEVFDADANLPESFAHCQAAKMGKANTSPSTFKYVRARLLEYGWSQDRPLIFPLYNPNDATDQWYDASNCRIHQRNNGVPIAEASNNTCAKIVMDPFSSYVWEPVSCETRLPFMCNKGHDIEYTSNETYVGKQIDRNTTGVAFGVFQNRTTPYECETHCHKSVRTCIAVEVVQINDTYWECTAAMINFNEFFHLNMSVQISLIPAPDNYTVFVKGLNQSDEVIINNGTMLETFINFTESSLGCNYDYNFPTTTPTRTCNCSCSFTEYSNAELQTWIEEVKNELLLNKRELSSNARTKISASDPRASSQTIGCLGALVIVAVVGIIVIPDIPIICKQIKYLTKR
ncbi:uncharacterized protein LOC125680997 [Ostrea edulis]|uniref:uncharacterized protein LOC125680997 n=1 Tax=Ostrea edulis TaxID=37623 RepID=UPI002095E413|nr:uncharacterized protein LOC125680997 [Ostrea edulis]